MKRNALFVKVIAFAAMLTLIMAIGVSCKSDADATGGKNTTGIQATPDPKAAAFDDSNVVFKVGIMSDIHIDMGSTASTKFANALQYLTELTGGSLNALMLNGDLTDHAKQEEVKEFKQVLLRNLPSEVSVFYALGNHDDGLSPKKFAEIFGEGFFQKDIAPEQINKGHRHAVIGGYHFLTVRPAQYWNGDKGTTFAKSTLKWLKETLDQIVAEEPDKPIFITSHSPVADMAIGSYLPYLSTYDLKELLTAYPQVVYTNGHLHNPIQNETAIMQDKFTVIDGGVIRYAGKDEAIEYNVHPYVVQDNLKDYDRGNHAFGVLLEIDGNQAMRITRIDYQNRALYPVKWYIPPVKADGSHLSAYTASRYEEDPAPYFPEGAAVNLVNSAIGKMVLAFDAAKDENFVHHYKLDVIENTSGEVVCKVNLESGFFQFSDMSKIQDKYTCMIENLERGKSYTLKIYAYDSWYKASEPLIHTFQYE